MIASNSGVHRGASKLSNVILNNRCWHHIPEVLIGTIWEKNIFGNVKTLDNPRFKNLTDKWGDLTHDTYQSQDIKDKSIWLWKLKENSRSF